MEYLLVQYPRRRKVRIDGEHNGYSNEPIELEGGPHTVTLSPPPNFAPKLRKVTVRNTSVLSPKVVVFERNEDATA